MSNFAQNVLKIVNKISRGKTMSYKQVAILSGYPGAYRAVGAVLKNNFDERIPCHRVIKSNGQAGEYNRGAKKKIKLLRQEGAI